MFIHNDFLLLNDASRRLYHEFAATQPIIDYHCHLSPADIANDRRFADIAEAWLAGDHYKWRAMRACGVDERLITGDAPPREKFRAWGACVPKLLRNPLYHWTHLELKRYFGIDSLLSPETENAVWNETQSLLATRDFSARNLISRMNVEVVCTTDDPIDSLEHHAQLAADKTFTTRVLPTFRPDRATNLASPKTKQIDSASIRSYNEYVTKLADVAGVAVSTLDDLIEAITRRHQFFHDAGCRLSDHGFGRFRYVSPAYSDIAAIFRKVRKGGIPTSEEAALFASFVLEEVARLDARAGWTMQLHIGAMRNNNSAAFDKLGPDTGYDSIGDGHYAADLAAFWDCLAEENLLPKTIVYNLNPTDNAMLATLIGTFQGDNFQCDVPGKMQFGSGWWFLDQRDGMIDQLNTLSQLGVLSLFVGMLTDSRSLLSYTRHEYFRRILCQLLGDEMQTGLIPNDFEHVGEIVKDICYRNAKNYFGW
ncbi:MAG: glucuronate isomerase [Thermoguttaceae bacterium]